MIYVMSDLHGEYEQFIEMLKKINFSSEDKLYILGDVFDRGERPLDIIDYIRKPENSNIKMILGNHEAFYLESLESDFTSYLWLQNGGESTFNQLKEKDDEYVASLINFIKGLPLYEIVDNYILVHAGINLPQNVDGLFINEVMEAQTKDDLIWDRAFVHSDNYIEGYTVVCGHTPTINIENYESEMSKIKHSKGKIMIDCGAFYKMYNGRLGCLRLDDMKEFYID